VVAIAVLAVAGTWLAPYDPNRQDLMLGVSRPGADHWLGTDDLGRDILSRVLAGARSAVIGPALIAGGSLLVGSVLGLLAGYRGRWIDAVIMRWADVMFTLPPLLVVLVVVGVFGGGYYRAVILYIILIAPFDTRIVRGATMEQRDRPYVEAARTIGISSTRIMRVHIWPNIRQIEVANGFLTYSWGLVALASLSFLGLGSGPRTADWGRMLADGRSLLGDNPFAALAPGIMLVVTAAATNLLGDIVFERMSDRERQT